MNLQIVIEPGEDGYFVARVPALRSCWSQGRTRNEAVENVREAIQLYLEREPNEVGEDGGREIVEIAV